MKKTDRRKIYSDAWTKWGFELQMITFMEEASELIKAVSKYARGWKKSTRCERYLIEEIADVEIMIEQLEMQHNWCNWRQRIDTAKHDKLLRLKKTLEGDR